MDIPARAWGAWHVGRRGEAFAFGFIKKISRFECECFAPTVYGYPIIPHDHPIIPYDHTIHTITPPADRDGLPAVFYVDSFHHHPHRAMVCPLHLRQNERLLQTRAQV